MTVHDRIRLASVTKMFTYATVMELVRKDRFRLSDRAIDLLPPGTLDAVPSAGDITVAQLLDHTSGLHNFNGENGADFFAALFADPRRGSNPWLPADLIAFAKNPRHLSTGLPGQRRSYSSTGYIVLQMIMEHREGKTFPTLFREHLFTPLGMSSAGVEGADFGADSIVDSYSRPTASDLNRPSPFLGRKAQRDDRLVNLSRGLTHYNAWAGAAGAAAASVRDIAKFMAGVVAGQRMVLKDQDAEFARAKVKPDASFSWNGGSWGIQASIIYEPHRDLTVIVLTNASNAGASSHDIANQLLLAARE